MGSVGHNFAHNTVLLLFPFILSLDPVQQENLPLCLSAWGLNVSKTSHIFSFNLGSLEVQSCRGPDRLPGGCFLTSTFILNGPLGQP